MIPDGFKDVNAVTPIARRAERPRLGAELSVALYVLGRSPYTGSSGSTVALRQHARSRLNGRSGLAQGHSRRSSRVIGAWLNW